MKKYLFISNSTKPTPEEENSREKVKLSNVSLPCIEAALNMDYKVFMGVNKINAEELQCESAHDIKFYNSSTYRSLTDIKSNYRAFKNLMHILRKEKINVIHCNTPIGGIMGRICGRLANVQKVIYTAHGFHFYKGAPILNRTLFKLAEMWMASFTDAIITMNQEDYLAAQKFRLRNNGKVYYIPGVGIDTKNYQNIEVNKEEIRNSLGLNKDDIVIISMGDLVPRKNFTNSIKAIAHANKTKLHFLICGNGPELGKLQQLTKEYGLENNIHFLGFRSDIKELLAISDIFLFTSYQEGLPRATMEAMATGLPCIVSKVRGNVDLIEDNTGGYLLNPDDIGGIGAAINLLVNDKNKRIQMGLYNKDKIKNFDIQIINVEMQKIYREVLF